MESKSKSFLVNESTTVTTDIEKGTGAARSFKRQLTIPIIAYLTLQNFLITTLIAGFATGFYYNYSFSANRQSAVHGLEMIRNFTKLQQGFTAEEVNDHIHIFLSQPVLVLKTSGDLQATGLLALDNFGAMYPWFLHHIYEYDMVASIAFVEYPSSDSLAITSYNDGEMVMYNLELTNSRADRLCPESISVGGFCPVTNGNNTVYPITGSMGDMADMDVVDTSMATTEIDPPMFGSPDPTELGAFTMNEAEKNAVSWFPRIRVTDPTNGILGLYFVYPVWSENDTFLGSFVGEMNFLITQELLHHLKEESTENTVIYIFQRDEVMIGTSTEEPVVQFDPESGTASSMKVTDMTNPFINFTQAYFRSEFGGSFMDVELETMMDADLVDPSSGIQYVFRFTALSPGTNLEWMVVVGAPEKDYTGATVALQNEIYSDLQGNNRNVVIMIFTFQFVLILAVVALLWYRVVHPLRTLVVGMNKAKEFDFSAISEGTFVTSPSGLSEVYECEKAFFDMTAKFAAAFKQNRALTQRQGAVMSGSGSGDQSGSADRPDRPDRARSGLVINVTKTSSTAQLPLRQSSAVL